MIKKNTIFNELKDQIISGKLLPNTYLSERNISDQYKISRTPLREILWRLKSNGLISRGPSGGYIVRNISLEEICDIFQTRESIEGIAARIACLKGDEKFLVEIKKLGERIKEIDINRNPQEHVLFGRQLHDIIVITADNPFLLEFYKKLKDLSALIRNITKNSHLIEKKSKEAHLKIIDVLNKKDEEKSEKYMREHLKTTCKLMIETLYPNIFI